MSKEVISIVIPCFCSEHSIAQVVEETLAVMKDYTAYEVEFILVNDGSSDNTFAEIKKLAETHSCVTGIDLSKNFGQHNAILAGMKYARGAYVVGMDDDLQTDPHGIPLLIEKLKEGFDVVYGRFKKRKHGVVRNTLSKLSHASVHFLIDASPDVTPCPLYAARSFVCQEIIKSKSGFSNLQGLFWRTTSNITNVEVNHHKRMYGASGYTFKKLMHLWASLLNYSIKPIRLLFLVGLFVFLIALVTFICLAISSASYGGLALALIALFGGLILCSIGLVGEYLGRTFLVITKEPQYVIKTIVQSEEEGESEV